MDHRECTLARAMVMPHAISDAEFHRRGGKAAAVIVEITEVQN